MGQRRLSVVELSELGSQPMVSSNERWVIVFNGEVYNYKQLRNELSESAALKGTPVRFRGSSDTEVILECIDFYGLKEAVSKLVGMFAIAVFDREKKELHLIRDRMGEKPLYYGFTNGTFFFCSELKSIYNSGLFNNPLDIDAISLYFRYGYVPAPYTVFTGVRKLVPGTILKISDISKPFPEPEPYWSILQIVEDNRGLEFDLSEEALLEQTEALLKQAIQGQMYADVPVGAFLSGGIDSSLTSALMQSLNSNPINTFTIGFSEKEFNEAEEAKKVAEILKTNHTEMYVSSKDAMNVIPDLPEMYDEPFSDSSQIPTYIVSKFAKQKVTVCLAGDAGDELFGGYSKYVATSSIRSRITGMPKPVRKVAAAGLGLVPTGFTNKTWGALSRILPEMLRTTILGDKVRRLSGILTDDDIRSLYILAVSIFKDPRYVMLNANEYSTVRNDDSILKLFDDDISLMMVLDMLTYLSDDILVKVDRAAMAVSLETRAPFLDHRIVEFALRMPVKYKIKDGKTKWPLRQILYKYVPKELVERPKMGFAIPVGSWMRNDLREWAEDLLDEKTIKEQGLLNPDIIGKLWKEHLTKNNNWQHPLWTVLMFQSWLQKYKNEGIVQGV
jgi:asparagine synthase (glutamine-hydrolysing)